MVMKRLIISVLLIFGCASTQWLHRVIPLMDSLGEPIEPYGIYFISQGNCVYVEGEEGIAVYDVLNGNRIAQIGLEASTEIVCNPNNSKVYVVNNGAEHLAIVDGVTHQVLRNIGLGGNYININAIAYNPVF